MGFLLVICTGILYLYLLLLLLWCYSPCSLTLVSLMTFIHSDQSWAFLLHPLIPIILKSTYLSFSLLNVLLPTFLLPSSLASKAPLGFLLFSILIKWPSHSSLLILMSVTISLSQYRLLSSSFVLIFQVPLSQIGLYIFLCIFLSQVLIFTTPSNKIFITVKSCNTEWKIKGWKFFTHCTSSVSLFSVPRKFSS